MPVDGEGFHRTIQLYSPLIIIYYSSIPIELLYLCGKALTMKIPATYITRFN